MNRRLATVGLHWSNVTLLMLVLADGGESRFLAWAFGLTGLAMTGLALAKGLMNGPGPKLAGGLRRAHPWISRLMYVLLGWASVSVLAGQVDVPLPGPDTRTTLLIVLTAGLLHGIFNLWRSTALNDGALRRMLP
jgi:hypothetical protein